MPSTSSDESIPEVKQSLFSWFVLAASFINNMLLIGYMKGVGTLFVEWQIAFEASAKSVSWIGAIMGICTTLSVYLSGIAASHLFCRTIVIFSGVLVTSATFTASWTTQLWQLYVLSALQGVGCGLGFGASVTALGYYFKKNIGFATSVCFAGVGMGIIVIPPLIATLSYKVHWSGALIVISAMMLLVILSGFIFKPTDREIFLLKKIDKDSEYEKASDERSESEENGECNVSQFQQDEQRHTKSVMTKTLYFGGIDLLFNNKDVFFASLSFFFFALGYYSSLVYLPSLAVFDLGLSKKSASFLTTAIGIGSVVGRLAPGMFIDKNICRPVTLLAISPILTAVSSLSIPSLHTHAGLLVAACWFGIFTGMYNAVVASHARSISKPHEFSRSFGAIYLLNCFGNFIGVITMGYLQDIFQSYDVSFYFAGVAFLLSSSSIFVNMVCRSCRSTGGIEKGNMEPA